MTLHALVVAVETYQDPKIPSVTYAENDATAFSTCIEGLGVSPGNLTLLTNSTATKTAIESKLRTLTKYLQEGDEFFLYYAGHGFSQAGKNYILCHDTTSSSSTEAALTSIPLDSVFDLIRHSRCKRVSLFLDSCHSGLEIDGGMRSFTSKMTDEEFKDFCGQSEYYVAFSACSTDEVSYSTPMLKHGVWTYHLIQALSGNAPSALERNHFVTSSSLQNYVSLEVPRKLRDVRTDKAVQTPTCWGNLSREFIVANLEDVMAAQRARKRGGNQIKDTILQHTSVGSVRSLSGFKKNHKVPDSICFATRSFVQTIGANEASDIVDSIHEKLKKKIKYKRKELKIALSPKIRTTG